MGLTVSRRKSKFFYRQPSKIQINIYYICSEIYHNIIWQINIICWKLLAIWLVGRFFSLVKIIVWPITGREWKSSQVKKIVSLFPPFHVCFLWEKEESDGVVFGHFKVRRYSFSQGIHRRTRKWEHKKKTEQSIALLQEFLTLKGVSRALEEIPPDILNLFISEFIITVRKKDDNENCELSSLRGMLASFERYF